VLLATVLGSAVAALDATVVNIALPRIADDLDARVADVQWISNGYLLSLASLILLGGALGDRYGRRRVFLIGVVWFAAASLLCGAAPTAGWLVAGRVLQGVGGALLTPGSLAIIDSAFAPEDRGAAIGLWSGLGGVATAIGPFAGGWLVELSWRWAFLVNLPVALAVVAVSLRHVPESSNPGAGGRPDVAGSLLGAAGLALTTYGLAQRTVLISVVGLAVLAAFVLLERRVAHPMLPLAVFRSRAFSATNATTFVVYAGLGVAFFLLGLVLQTALGYSPVAAGAATLPITFLMLGLSSRAGRLAQRIGPRWPLTVGPLVVSVGMLLFVRVEPGAGYLTGVLPAVLVFGSGLALLVAPLTATVLAAADEAHAGVASGVNNAVARTAQLLAVAAVPLVARLDPGAALEASALVDGFHRCMVAAAVLVALGGAVAFAFVPSTVLSGPAPDGGEPYDERTPCLHCGVAGPPLVVSGD
jgi:EmrB/QacA subfamily drug resistance transporter